MTEVSYIGQNFGICAVRTRQNLHDGRLSSFCSEALVLATQNSVQGTGCIGEKEWFIWLCISMYYVSPCDV